ncbi:MAG: 30S ribosome-binding factor RbfA [Candidatus Riflebacteria bacterium]|nr:30S ribosome-binding factor RbfA [Candidatus Riflebacteria bacterium]
MTRRQERVSALIMRDLSEIIQRRLQDPRIKNVHIVNIEISPDFSFAKVYYSFLGESEQCDEIQKGLDSAKGFMRRELKKKLDLRVIPELAFFYDSSVKRGDHILELLKKINN